MSKFTNWTPAIENKPSDYDDDESFIVKSWQHDHIGQTVSVMHEPEDSPETEENPYHIEIESYGTYGEYSSARDAKEDAGRVLDQHPNGFGEMRDGLPKDSQVTFTTGKPVKAQKYYSIADEGFVEHTQPQPLYGIGRDGGSKGVAYSSDLKQVQAYSSEVIFVYSRGGELSHDELEQVINKQSEIRLGAFQHIYLYRDGRAIPALKTGTDSVRRKIFQRLVKEYEETSLETNLTAEQAEDTGSFSLFT